VCGKLTGMYNLYNGNSRAKEAIAHTPTTSDIMGEPPNHSHMDGDSLTIEKTEVKKFTSRDDIFDFLDRRNTERARLNWYTPTFALINLQT
jgi:hypothetical protein